MISSSTTHFIYALPHPLPPIPIPFSYTYRILRFLIGYKNGGASTKPVSEIKSIFYDYISVEANLDTYFFHVKCNHIT